MHRIMKCPKCNIYSMKETCQTCSSKMLKATPLKYSNDQIIANIRRDLKSENAAEEL